MSYAPFVSPTDLEALLGETLVNPTALIVAISLDAACESVRGYIGQIINLVEDDVEIHSGTGRRVMRLRQRPVRSIEYVKVDGTTLETTEYTARDAILTKTDQTWWDFGNDNIEVKYTHGWDVEEPTSFPVPADIRLVALIAARRVYQAVGFAESGSAGGLLIAETIGDYSYQLSDPGAAATVATAAELGEGEQFALDRYRIALVGPSAIY